MSKSKKQEPREAARFQSLLDVTIRKNEARMKRDTDEAFAPLEKALAKLKKRIENGQE